MKSSRFQQNVIIKINLKGAWKIKNAGPLCI